MLQAGKLHQLVSQVKAVRPLTVICYTGFTLESLRETGAQDVIDFLKNIDVLIDGPYIDKLNNDTGLRGSSNQGIHFLTGMYKDHEHQFLNGQRNLEMHLFEARVLTVGIHARNWKKPVR